MTGSAATAAPMLGHVRTSTPATFIRRCLHAKHLRRRTTDEFFGDLEREQRNQVTPVLSELRNGGAVIVWYAQHLFAVHLPIGGDFGSPGWDQTARPIAVNVRRHEPDTIRLRELADTWHALPLVVIVDVTWERMIAALRPAGDLINAGRNFRLLTKRTGGRETATLSLDRHPVAHGAVVSR